MTNQTTLTSRVAGLTLAAACAVAAVTPIHADEFPSQPIKIVVPYAAGGGTDILARLIGQEISASMGQPVIVDNRPGGSTFIGSDAVARARPDGYTLLASAASTFAINPSLYKNLPYDPVGSFSPITLVARFPLLLVVSKDFPARTVQEFIAYTKARPGELNFGSAGIGSTHHLAMELFKQRAGLDMVHVPYRGAGPAVQDLMAGRIPVMFLDVTVATSPLQSGMIRALGIATSERFSELPDVPTISEAGVAGFEASAWNGVVAPAGTPPPVVERLNAEIGKALQGDAFKTKLHAMGIEPAHMSSSEFAAYIKSEIQKWGDVIRKGNITVNQ